MIKSKWALCGIDCNYVDALRMLECCLKISVKYYNGSYRHYKDIVDLRWSITKILKDIEIERLECIGINFY